MHIHAVSVSVCTLEPDQFGVLQPSGQPDHADGLILGGSHAGGSSPTTTTPLGSPGTAEGGPTVPGAASAGVLSFGIVGPPPPFVRGLSERRFIPEIRTSAR
jgi:hypothetical protein